MILFTKEVFVRLRELTSIHVQADVTKNKDGVRSCIWQVQIQGAVDTISNGMDSCFITIEAESKEDAYRIYRELAQQVIDSGCFSELNSQLIDNVLKET